MMTWRQLLQFGEEKLSSAGICDSSFDAFQLVLEASGYTKDMFFLNDDKVANAEKVSLYNSFLQRRIENEPLQYILGKWDFFDSEFFVGEGVLIPRPETEELVEKVIEIVKNNNFKVVYDLCSGSGCIGLSVAMACPDVFCYLFELYDKAFDYSEKNLNALGIKNAKVVRQDILDIPSFSLPCADVIVSNPPYIATCEIASLQEEVLKEPHTALDGGIDGLMFYRAIYEKWLSFLSNSGYVAFECGEGQSKSICDIFSDKFDCDALSDTYGVDRFVIGKRI